MISDNCILHPHVCSHFSDIRGQLTTEGEAEEPTPLEPHHNNIMAVGTHGLGSGWPWLTVHAIT